MTGTKNLKLFVLLLALFACGKEEQQPAEQRTEFSSVAEEEAVKEDFEQKHVDFSSLTGWKNDDLKTAMAALALSCQKIVSSSDEFLSDKAIVKIPTAAYKDICQKLETTAPLEYHNFIEQNFTPYQVLFKESDIGQFTSYFEPTIRVSEKRSYEYNYPIYGRPYDLFEMNLRDFDESYPNKKLMGRVVGQKFVPYYTREEISKIMMKAPVILWAANPVDLFIVQIQGSAVAETEDGRQVRIAYDSNNGHKFTGIGKILLDRKLIRRDKASMMEIKKWMHENYDVAKDLMNENKRYVFHRLSYENGPIGAEGVVLTAGRSLAVDESYIPYGSLLWLETTMPKQGETYKMVVAQDTGEAIKGAIRGDYFWGTGSDDILELAGKMNSTGRYYIFIPKGVEVNL